MHCGDGGATAFLVRYHGGNGGAAAVMAVPRRSHCGLAQPAVCSKFPPCRREGPTFDIFPRCYGDQYRNHCGLCRTTTAVAPRLRCDGGRRSAVLTIFRGATAINDGTTAEPRRSWRCHCGLCRTSTAVAPRLRCDGGISVS